jgi:hypothetical protein
LAQEAKALRLLKLARFAAVLNIDQRRLTLEYRMFDDSTLD